MGFHAKNYWHMASKRFETGTISIRSSNFLVKSIMLAESHMVYYCRILSERQFFSSNGSPHFDNHSSKQTLISSCSLHSHPEYRQKIPVINHFCDQSEKGARGFYSSHSEPLSHYKANTLSTNEGSSDQLGISDWLSQAISSDTGMLPSIAMLSTIDEIIISSSRNKLSITSYACWFYPRAYLDYYLVS